MAMLKVIGFALLLSYIESAPPSTSTPSYEQWPADWKTTYQNCESDILRVFDIICNSTYFDGTVETYNKRSGEIVSLAIKCCLYACNIEETKKICAEGSVFFDHLLIHKSTSSEVAAPTFPTDNSTATAINMIVITALQKMSGRPIDKYPENFDKYLTNPDLYATFTLKKKKN